MTISVFNTLVFCCFFLFYVGDFYASHLHKNFKIYLVFFGLVKKSKIWARSVQPFHVYWIQIDRQTSRQASSIYTQEEDLACFSNFFTSQLDFSHAYKVGNARSIKVSLKAVSVQV